MNILVTGATGFIGKNLIPFLLEQGHCVTGIVRRKVKSVETLPGLKYCNIKELDADTDWQPALSNIDVIIHLAARVHVMQDKSPNPVAEFDAINVAGSLNLAKQAVKANVYRMIFISSIKVFGEFTTEKSFMMNEVAQPKDPYGQSKLRAENELRKLLSATTTSLVILRLPLVYGPEMKGNLAILEQAIHKHLPLPLGLVRNKRDLISIYNLCDIIQICITSKAVKNQTLLLADGQPLSSKAIIKAIAGGLGKRAILLPVPIIFMKTLLIILGKSTLINKLFGNLEVDISETKKILDWEPKYSVEQSFIKMYAK